jgi:hypothetical protein
MWFILLCLGLFFSSFGQLQQEKSGNPGSSLIRSAVEAFSSAISYYMKSMAFVLWSASVGVVRKRKLQIWFFC